MDSVTATAKQDAALVSAKFVNEWGVFRRFIAKHPFTGWLIGVAVGVPVGFLAAHVL